MRGRDRSGGDLDPTLAGALAVLDAAVAGEPADPEYTELYELARLVGAQRPAPRAGELAALDRAITTRGEAAFPGRARPGAATGSATPSSQARGPRWRVPRPLLGGAAAALAAGALAAVVIALPGGGGGGVAGTSSSASVASSSSASGGAGGVASAGGSSASAPAARSAPAAGESASSHRAANAGNFFAPSTATQYGTAVGAPHPDTAPGRQVVQGAQLDLGAPAARIDQVAQEVFDVVGTENGIVNRSTVDSGGAANAYASFSLSIPSANLPEALRLLSSLRGAQVLSRIDSTSDITGTVNAAGVRLAEDRALRTSLLHQLAAATTDAEVASLRGQLHAVDGRIAADTGRLNGLHHQVADSQVTVTIQPASPAPAPIRHSGGFTLRHALHVAGRVLVVAAGVALIALAVALPLGLAAALVAWIWLAVRRRRREAALDLL